MKKYQYIIILLILVLLTGCSKKAPEPEVPDKIISYTIPENYKEVNLDNFYYYPKDDLTGKKGYISVIAFESDKEFSKDYIKEIKKEYESYNIKSIKEYKTPNYKGVVFTLGLDGYDVINYHILSGYVTVYVYGVDYHIYPDFAKDVKSIVDSLDI